MKWLMPLILFFPIILLATVIHESGHAVAAILLGGSVREIEITSLYTGLAIVKIPDMSLAWVVLISGGLIQAAFFLLISRRWQVYLVSSLGALMYAIGEATGLVVLMGLGMLFVLSVFAILGVLCVLEV